MESENEVWKVYPEFNFIQGSNFGRVRTIDRYVKQGNGKRFVKGRILKQCPDKGGYLLVTFNANGKTVNRKVHRVVASCFLPNPLGLPEVNHIDCDPSDNYLNNIEWCTRKYNRQYREKYGEACGRSVYAVNLKTQEILRFKSQSGAERSLGVAQQSISAVIKGKRNQAGGFWFTRADDSAVANTCERFGKEVAEQVTKLMEVQNND